MLKVQARHLGSVVVLVLQGQIVNGETESLRNAVHAVATVSIVKLDFARVTTIDAGGLGVLLELRELANAKGIRFELTNVNKQINRVLEVTRLNSVFRITSSVEFFPGVTGSRQEPAARLASCA